VLIFGVKAQVLEAENVVLKVQAVASAAPTNGGTYDFTHVTIAIIGVAGFRTSQPYK